MKFILNLFLFFLTSFSIYGETNFFNIISKSQVNKLPLQFEASVGEIVHILRFDFGLRVNFESDRKIFNKDKLTANQVLEMYNNNPKYFLLPNKKIFIEYIKKEFIAKGKGDSFVDYKKPTITVNRTDFLDLSKLMDEIKSMNIYAIKFSNASIIIYPKDVEYNMVENFQVSFDNVSQLFEKINPILKERHLSMKLNMGILSQKYSKKIILKIENEDFRVFLSRFADVISSNLVWTIYGNKETKTLIFIKINKKGESLE